MPGFPGQKLNIGPFGHAAIDGQAVICIEGEMPNSPKFGVARALSVIGRRAPTTQ
jgi:hypothetical protein